MPPVLQPISSIVTKRADGFYVTVGNHEVKALIPDEGLDIDDIAQLCPLGPDLHTSDLLGGDSGSSWRRLPVGVGSIFNT